MQEGKAKMWKLGKITAKTHIGDYGQIVDSFVLLLKDTCCDFSSVRQLFRVWLLYVFLKKKALSFVGGKHLGKGLCITGELALSSGNAS